MVRTVEITEAHLGDLIERTQPGDEVLITVNGKVKARLTPVEEQEQPPDRAVDTRRWAEELSAIRQKYSAFAGGPSSQEILDELREERL
jgi:prevent-host-death family protein